RDVDAGLDAARLRGEIGEAEVLAAQLETERKRRARGRRNLLKAARNQGQIAAGPRGRLHQAITQLAAGVQADGEVWLEQLQRLARVDGREASAAACAAFASG